MYLLSKLSVLINSTVVKASSTEFDWHYVRSVVQTIPLREIIVAAKKQLPNQWIGRSNNWLLVSVGAMTLMFWNGRLVLATGVGVAVMLFLRQAQKRQIEYPSVLLKQLDRFNNPMSLAIASGGLVSFSTYLAASIWVESSNVWIALGSLLQGAGTVGVIFLLIRHLLDHQAHVAQPDPANLVNDLTHREPLKRLIAVRQLTAIAIDLEVSHPQRKELRDYFRLMLRSENEPIVRDALIASLQLLTQREQLQASTQPSMRVPYSKNQVAHSDRRRVPAHEW